MLIVNAKTRHRYTLRELLECEYPELLEAAENGRAVLTGLQNAIVELLPLSKRLHFVDLSER